MTDMREGNYIKEQKRLLDYQEAANYLGIRKSLLRTLVCQRRIECVKIGRRVYFTRSILDSFIKKNTRKTIKV